MENLGSRIRKKRKELGISQTDLGEKIGMKQQGIMSIENGKSLRPRLLLELAQVLKTTPEWLLNGEGASDQEDVGNNIQDPPDLMPLNTDKKTVLVPEYDFRASMGGGYVVDQETIKDIWPFSRRYVENDLRLQARGLLIIEVVGDSMEPTLSSGDRVMVDTSDKRIGIPGIFVLWDGDGMVAKRLQKIPGTDPAQILSISDNPLQERYKVFADEINIVGRVVWFARRM